MSFKTLIQCVVLPVAVSFSLSACGGGDVYVDAPFLEAVGIDLNKKQAEADVPVRPGIVLPPSTEKLPKPGEATKTASKQNWPEDADLAKQRKEEQAAAEREAYCRNGEWDKGNIDEFEKNVGNEQRCQSSFVEAIGKALGGGPAGE